jgi:excisionase family DNA binding protein
MPDGVSDYSFLTVAEVAELLKLNQQTVRNWIDQGTLPAFRVGRRVRIDRKDLEDLLAAGYKNTATASVADENAFTAKQFWQGEDHPPPVPPPPTPPT